MLASDDKRTIVQYHELSNTHFLLFTKGVPPTVIWIEPTSCKGGHHLKMAQMPLVHFSGCSQWVWSDCICRYGFDNWNLDYTKKTFNFIL